MKTTNLYSKSHPNASRIIEVLDWVVAIDAFDFDEVGPLLELMKEEREVPVELRPIINAIVRKQRLPNKKAAVKQKIPAKDRLMLAAVTSALLGFFDHGLSVDSAKMLGAHGMTVVEQVAADRRVEPIEISRMIRKCKDLVKAHYASEFGIKKRTLEGYLRDLRRIIENYPDF